MGNSGNRRLKYWRKGWLGLGVLVLAAALLLWFLPARWALAWIEPQLHGLRLQQVHGLLWEGRAAQVRSADGSTLGQLQWRLSRRALLGQVQLQLDFHGPQLNFSGAMQRLSGDRVEWHDVDINAGLAAWHPRVALTLGQPRGDLRVSVDHALLQGGWPLLLQAHAQWQHAVMRTRQGDVALGNLQWQVRARNGVIDAQVLDDGHGPLQVEGQLQLSPLGWRLDVKLRARQTDPALHRWLVELGPRDAAGAVHITRSGGLAASLPQTPNQHARQP
jgi:general secretion pathway protein N